MRIKWMSKRETEKFLDELIEAVESGNVEVTEGLFDLHIKIKE